ncbi:lipopolysaccharide biosynthesis protein, partial [Vibrio splendidus]
AILAITSDRLLGWVLIDVHDFVLGGFVAIVTLVVFVRYSVIPVPQALLDKFTLGKQSHVS